MRKLFSNKLKTTCYSEKYVFQHKQSISKEIKQA